MTNIPNFKITLKTAYNLFKSQDVHQDGLFTDWLHEQINKNDHYDITDTFFLHDVLKELNINHSDLEPHRKGFTYKYFDDYPKVLIREVKVQ